MRQIAWTIALVALAISSATAQTGCPRCVTELELSAAQWRCLLNRTPAFQAQGTPVVFFTLSEAACRTDPGPSLAGDIIVPGPVNAPPGAPAPPRVLQMSQQQLECLSRRAGSVQPAAGQYRFDFNTQCAGE